MRVVSYAVFVGLLLLTTNLGAQPTGGGPGGGGPPVPISGIEFLIAGGALLGLRKLIRNKKRSVS